MYISGAAPIMSSVGTGGQTNTVGTQANHDIPGVLSVLPHPGGAAAEDIINAVQEMLEQAAAQVNATTTTNNNSTSTDSGTGTSPRFRSQGVSTETTTQWTTSNVSINESILTLLLKLHAKLSTKPNSYVPESVCGRSAHHTYSRIGDGPFFIGKVLDKLCVLSEDNARVVQQYYHSNLPKTDSNSSKKEGLDREERFVSS